jgi:hypothetical protein
MNKLAIDRFRFGLQWCMAKAITLVSKRQYWQHAQADSRNVPGASGLRCLSNTAEPVASLKYSLMLTQLCSVCACRVWTSPSPLIWMTAWSMAGGATPWFLTHLPSMGAFPTTM